MSHLTHDSRLTLTKSPPPSPHSSPLSLLRLSSLQNVSIGALFLAAKVEESPRKVRDVLNVYHHLEQKRGGVSTPAPLDVYSSRYNQYKERLVRAEREILKELGFILYCEHPHKFILNYVKLLTADSDTCGKLAQYAWNFINDSQRTNLCTKYAPEVICCAGIWLAARILQIKLPSTPETPWWEIFNATKDDMEAVVASVTSLYARPRASFVKLEPDALPVPPPKSKAAPAVEKAEVAPAGGEGGGEGATHLHRYLRQQPRWIWLLRALSPR